MKKKVEKTQVIDPDEAILTEVMDKFKSSRDYIKKGFSQTWKDCRKIYNSQRVEASYEGSSDTFVPETFTIVQSVKSNVVGGKIKLEFLPTNYEQSGDLKVLNALNDQWWTEDNTKLKASWAVDDALQVGNGYLWQYWNGKHPCNLYIPTEDNFFDPTATNYENLRWGGYRYTTTIQDLKKETITNPEFNPEDEKSEARIKRYKNLEKIDNTNIDGAYKTPNDKTAKQLREEMVAGSVIATGKEKSSIVEVIVYHDKDKIVRVANRGVVIENAETWAQRKESVIESFADDSTPIPVTIPEIKPFIPVAPARDYVDGAMWYAKGEVEVILPLQENLNDTQNQKTDNMSFANNRMFALDPSQAHKKDEIQSIPGAVFTIPPGSLEAIPTPSIGADADNEMYRIQKMMRSATAADEIVQGGSQKGTQTATEINSQLMQAGTRFASKLENFESEFFKILATNMFKIAQIFINTEQAVRMIGQQGVEWKNYNPGEFLGDWDVKVALEANAKALKEEEKQSAMQFYLMAAKLPFIDQEILFKITADKLFDIDRTMLDKIAPNGSGIQMLVQQGVQQEIQRMTEQASAQANGEMTQSGAGDMASAPQAPAENAVNAGVQQSNGMNVPGMVQG